RFDRQGVGAGRHVVPREAVRAGGVFAQFVGPFEELHFGDRAIGVIGRSGQSDIGWRDEGSAVAGTAQTGAGQAVDHDADAVGGFGPKIVGGDRRERVISRRQIVDWHAIGSRRVDPQGSGAIKEFHLADTITVGRSGRKRKGGRSRQHHPIGGSGDTNGRRYIASGV